MNRIKRLVGATVIGLALSVLPTQAGIINILTGNQTTSTNYAAAGSTNNYFVQVDTSKTRELALDMSSAGVTNTPAQTIGTIQAVTAVFACDLSDGMIQSNVFRLSITPNGTTTLTNAVTGFIPRVFNGSGFGTNGIGGVPRFFLTAIENPSTNIIATNIVINGFTKGGL